MKTYSLSEIETELKALDPRLEVRLNTNRPGLANVLLDGRDVSAMPAEEIREDIDPTYYYIFPNGMQGRHKSYTEIMASVRHILEYIKTEEGADTFFSR